MGEGGFGRVYKGTIPATGQVISQALQFLVHRKQLNSIYIYLHVCMCHDVMCVCSPI